MKKYALLFVAISSFSVANMNGNSEGAISKKSSITQAQTRMKTLYSSYLASLVVSGCVGATTGSLLRYAEKKLNIEASSVALFLMLLGWMLESEFRNDIIVAIEQDLNEYGIKYKRGLMFKGAWIASWIAYLRM